MTRRKKHRDRAKFSGRKQSLRGLIGFAIIIIALVALFTSVNFAFIKGGKAGIILGDTGVFCMFLTLLGWIIEIMALTEEDIYKMIPAIGTILGSLTLLSWIGIYCIGVFL
ncbi:MAG: hypothetical protein E7280_09475 [Lachnospiraceae bacterium]|nr:hypothetical protein [Lachnospiraceae bacterium]